MQPPTDAPAQVTDAPIGPASAPPRHPRRKFFRKIFLFVWLPLAVGFAFYLYYSYRATGFDAAAVMGSDDRVSVREEDTMTIFTPLRDAKPASLVFIPGAMVEPAAYAPLARSIAEHGHAVVVVKLPWRLASTQSQRDEVVKRVLAAMSTDGPPAAWVVAGHSVGGVLACQAARDHADLIGGMVLIGTSHPRDFDLSHLTIDVTKVTATNDGLASPAEVKANAKKLPPHTRWVEIAGGNHSQFGYYGFQLGDTRATISREAQQKATAKELLDALARANTAKAR